LFANRVGRVTSPGVGVIAFPLIVLGCATLISSHPAFAQFSQPGPKSVRGTLSRVAFENRFAPITTVYGVIGRGEWHR